MVQEKLIKLCVNGRELESTIPSHRTLLEVLRDHGFVDVKRGCEKGDCGACAVLVDGRAIDSCLTLAWTAEGKQITTIAGLGSREKLHSLQNSFIEKGAIQCGYCTPGMIIAAQSMLNENTHPSDADIRLALGGNLCRCTGYTKIFEAIRDAAAVIRATE